MFGHIHLKPYPYSGSVTGLSCGEKVTKNNKEKVSELNWMAVSLGEKNGYIYKEHLSNQSPECLQGLYPIFFQSLELDLTEIFLWGKLSDQYIEFETGK